MAETVNQPFDPVHCEACRAIDAADGQNDANLYSSVAANIRSEHTLWAAVLRAQDHTADRITSFAGSMRFVYIHIGWFAAWVLLNVGIAGAGLKFDKYPFGLLTMIVSLEAIFLSTFVMVSQNRQSARSDIRAELDFENNLRGEIWSVHIGKALNIDADHVEAVVREALVAARARLGEAPTSSPHTSERNVVQDPAADAGANGGAR